MAGDSSEQALDAARDAALAGETFDAGAIDGAVGLGVDIVEVARMKRILVRSPRFAERVFSVEERAYCDAMAHPEAHYAVRFAAKEAVVKALGTGFSQGVGVRDIEVVRRANGRPVVRLSGEAARIAAQAGVRDLPLSLSYTRNDAVACALAITESSVRAADERRDPKAELARKFKETRSILDEI